MEAFDYFENKLEIGDYVALSMESSTNLTNGKIVKISKGKKGNISVGVEVDVYNRSFKKNSKAIRYRRPYNVIKMSKELVIEKRLTGE
jgi:hypothetical protein